jgi:hypothetical protein
MLLDQQFVQNKEQKMLDPIPIRKDVSSDETTSPKFPPNMRAYQMFKQPYIYGMGQTKGSKL